MSKYLNKKFAEKMCQLESEKELLETEMAVLMEEIKKTPKEDKLKKRELYERKLEVEGYHLELSKGIRTYVLKTAEKLKKADSQRTRKSTSFRAFSSLGLCLAFVLLILLTSR